MLQIQFDSENIGFGKAPRQCDAAPALSGAYVYDQVTGGRQKGLSGGGQAAEIPHPLLHLVQNVGLGRGGLIRQLVNPRQPR